MRIIPIRLRTNLLEAIIFSNAESQAAMALKTNVVQSLVVLDGMVVSFL